MDNFKKHLQHHRDEMDFDEPAAMLWEKDETKTIQPRVRRLIVSVAAAAVIAGVIFTSVKILQDNKTVPSIAMSVPEKIDFVTHGLPDTLTEKLSIPVKQNTSIPAVASKKATPKKDERYALMNSFKESYGELVAYQLSSIRTTPVYAENPEYFNDFKTRLHQMDMDEINIRNSIKHAGMSKALLDQLINVYQQKLDMLRSLQSEINKMNNKVKQNNPSPDSLYKYYLNI